MSPYTQHTPTRPRPSGPRHRKPSPPNAGKRAINLGIATGVLGTLIAAAPANAAENESGPNTLEMSLVVPEYADAADDMRGMAHRIEIRDRQSTAAAEAGTQARTGMARARQAENERVAREKADREKADREKMSREKTSREKADREKAAQGKKKHQAAPEERDSPSMGAVADFARKKSGVAIYVWGASSGNAFDCSGLVTAAYKNAGITLPHRTSQDLSGAYADIKGGLKPGDIMYWGKKGAAYHVAIYVGGGKYVGAQNSKTGVVTRDVAGSGYTGAVRPG